MLQKYRLPGLLAVVIFLTFAGYHAATASDNVPVFKVFGDSPVLDHGKAGSWNAVYTDPGAVLYHDGLFHMFYNGFNGWPAPVQIGYATSPDGLHWTKQGDDPVLKTAQVDYAGVAALASSAIVLDDGSWALYFYTWENYGALLDGKGRIGRATAPKPTGPWTVDKKPVLEVGSAGAWDEQRVDAPSVLRAEKGFVMYYAGINTSGTQSIGMATSPDGLTWTKYNDPATTDTQFAESDPVFQKGEANAWDASRVHQPRVDKTPDGWVMLYRTIVPRQPATIGLGIATSADGIHWIPSKANPIFTGAKDFGKQGFWYTAFAYHDGTYFVYVEAPPPAHYSETAVYVATYAGSLAN